MLYEGISTALRAERALHAVNLAAKLVDQYVQKEGKWPRSWDDLKALTIENAGMYQWPEDYGRIQEYVSIDFAADPVALASQTVEHFDAVKPIGSCYVYTCDGYIAKLIETLKKKAPHIELTSIASVRLILCGEKEPLITAQLERRFVDDILDALEPNVPDPDPCKWTQVGALEIVSTTGNKHLVPLFCTGEKEAAFAIDRIYYRGGSDSKLIAALHRANKSWQFERFDNSPSNDKVTHLGGIKSLKQDVVEAKVIAVGVFVDSAPAKPNRPGDLPELLWRFRVVRFLKGKLDEKSITIRHPDTVGVGVHEIAGNEWVLFLSPENLAGKHQYTGLYNIKVEPEIRAILTAEGRKP
jgi:hypothetical protein